jgi:glucoamylase
MMVQPTRDTRCHDADPGALPPGKPGIEPRWTSSAKSGVGTSVTARSRVWFTVSHGIVNEVYYPRVDQANTRDLGLLVTAADGYFSEEKRHAAHQVELLAPGVPGYRLTNGCDQGRYRIVKTVLTDPNRDVLLQRVAFEPQRGTRADFRLFVLLAPHLGNRGYDNHGWVGAYKGERMLFAARDAHALALACSVPFGDMSCGYVGTSDGWQDITRYGHLTRCFADAPSGNVALTAEIAFQAAQGGFVLALGFGETSDEAAEHARASLLESFDTVAAEYVRGWTTFQGACHDVPDEGDGLDLYRVSTAVLHTHEDKAHRGATIASLSVPWGFARGDDDLGGYHLVWPRDLVETAGGLLAAGRSDAARNALTFLAATQEADGHWPQNMWLDGQPYWSGVQLDETGFPVLLADLLRRHDALDGFDPWPMVRRAACYLAQVGPVTLQDRWEEDAGYSPFTLAVTVAALLAAADFADAAGEPRAAAYLRDTADTWNDGIERWTYVTESDLARRLGVDGYYARIAPPDVADGASPATGFVPVKNRPLEHSQFRYGEIVSPDALALVRFGLRDPADPRIRNTVRAIDALLRADTATGPVWHRYNEDGYGEHESGAAFDGTGVGRGWPLLTAERGHYELARGDNARARELLQVVRAQASPGGFLPEQVWDAPDIPARELFNGRPSGSAMPLVWAHAEYIKLVRSLADGAVFDMPPQTVRRYREQRRVSRLSVWRFNHKIRAMAPGRVLRIEALAPAVVHWSVDGWNSVNDTPTADTGIGMFCVDLPTERLALGTVIHFTFRWLDADRWEGTDFEVVVRAG